MKTINKLACIATLAAALTGCGNDSARKPVIPSHVTIDCLTSDSAKYKDHMVEVHGTPEACTYNINNASSFLSIVLKGETGRVQCYGNYTYGGCGKPVMNISSLFQSELRDGDNDEVTVIGKYDGEYVKPYRVKVQGKTIELYKAEWE
ncbi:hypothetical protein HY642_02805 [Candidatus Woesearchaeota archaeon]|nr:hypothetical protein [Candidatus Woesearchaeota archaeon]